MANRFRITCITKPHPHSPVEHITHVGVPYGLLSSNKIPVEEVIRQIDSGQSTYYVKGGRYEAEVHVVRQSMLHRAYIRTVPDQTVVDNLLELPPCQ